MHKDSKPEEHTSTRVCVYVSVRSERNSHETMTRTGDRGENDFLNYGRSGGSGEKQNAERLFLRTV